MYFQVGKNGREKSNFDIFSFIRFTIHMEISFKTNIRNRSHDD